MSYIDIIGSISLFILVAYLVFIAICEEYNLLVSFRMLPKNKIKEWNRQRNNRTRELKKQIKEWNRQRNNKAREIKKQIKDWNNQRNQRLRDWKKRRVIHKKAWAFLQKLNFLKIIYGLIALAIGFALFTLFSGLLSQLLTKLFNAPNPFNLPKLEVVDSSFALAFLGTVTGIVALFGGYLAIRRSDEDKIQNKIAQKQADTAEQGLITDRISKATDGLGKRDEKGDMLEVRLGALYALERIAQDSLRDHIRIMKIICAYIRVRNQLINSRAEANPVGEDVRAAITIIGQRGKWTENQKHLKEEKKQTYQLDLRHCNFNNADLSNVNFSDAWLSDATLEASMLSGATLKNALLICTNLTNAKLGNTDFKDAYTASSFAYEGDFLTCLNLTQEQLNVMYCGTGVDIFTSENPKNLIRPDHWPTDNLTLDEFKAEYHAWLEKTYPNFVLESSKK